MGAGTRRRVACSWLPLTVWGSGWLGPSASFVALSLGTVGLLVGDASLRCYFGTCGGEGGPCPWAPSRLAQEATTCHHLLSARNARSAQSRTCPPMCRKPALLPGECRYLTASCLSFPSCRKRLVGVYTTLPVGTKRAAGVSVQRPSEGPAYRVGPPDPGMSGSIGEPPSHGSCPLRSTSL